MKETFYVVKVGKGLYVDTKVYSLYQSTTKELLYAHKFKSREEAEKLAKKASGEVEEIVILNQEGIDELVGSLKEDLAKANKRAEIAQEAFKEIISKKK